MSNDNNDGNVLQSKRNAISYVKAEYFLRSKTLPPRILSTAPRVSYTTNVPTPPRPRHFVLVFIPDHAQPRTPTCRANDDTAATEWLCVRRGGGPAAATCLASDQPMRGQPNLGKVTLADAPVDGVEPYGIRWFTIHVGGPGTSRPCLRGYATVLRRTAATKPAVVATLGATTNCRGSNDALTPRR